MSTIIDIPHLYRVEGHGGIEVHVGDNGVESCKLNVFEGSRFYEAILCNRQFHEVPGIVSRVCAICSVGHTLCSIAAIEDALGITVSEPVRMLRELLSMGQMVESHALHLFCLAAPDYLGFAGAIDMEQKFHNEVAKGLALKKYGNFIQESIGGRAIHPVNMIVGGVGTWPERSVLLEIRKGAEEALRALFSLEDFIASLENPDWAQSERVFVGIRPDSGRFQIFAGTHLQASGFDAVPIRDFRNYVNERVVAHSTAKQSHFSDKPFMVGPLARLMHDADKLTGESADLYERLFPNGMPPNPLLNNAAQFVELVFSCEKIIRLCDRLLKLPPEPGASLRPSPPAKTSTGAAALEVPRGTLIHSYAIDEKGIVIDADIITPTAQNLAQVEIDIGTTVNVWLKRNQEGGREGLKRHLEMLARAYDPCISCSTHLIELTFAE